jgi:hypothetical protein
LRRLYGALNPAREDHRWRPKAQGGDAPDRILTSHAGSLPRPEGLIVLSEQSAEGDFSNEAEYNDGEYGHSMGIKV